MSGLGAPRRPEKGDVSPATKGGWPQRATACPAVPGPSTRTRSSATPDAVLSTAAVATAHLDHGRDLMRVAAGYEKAVETVSHFVRLVSRALGTEPRLAY
jgi:hypothetical protein